MHEAPPDKERPPRLRLDGPEAGGYGPLPATKGAGIIIAEGRCFP
jgi:hypothetical protein